MRPTPKDHGYRRQGVYRQLISWRFWPITGPAATACNEHCESHIAYEQPHLSGQLRRPVGFQCVDSQRDTLEVGCRSLRRELRYPMKYLIFSIVLLLLVCRWLLWAGPMWRDRPSTMLMARGDTLGVFHDVDRLRYRRSHFPVAVPTGAVQVPTSPPEIRHEMGQMRERGWLTLTTRRRYRHRPTDGNSGPCWCCRHNHRSGQRTVYFWKVGDRHDPVAWGDAVQGRVTDGFRRAYRNISTLLLRLATTDVGRL